MGLRDIDTLSEVVKDKINPELLRGDEWWTGGFVVMTRITKWHRFRFLLCSLRYSLWRGTLFQSKPCVKNYKKGILTLFP